jgi:hypothetical protein
MRARRGVKQGFPEINPLLIQQEGRKEIRGSLKRNKRYKEMR